MVPLIGVFVRLNITSSLNKVIIPMLETVKQTSRRLPLHAQELKGGRYVITLSTSMGINCTSTVWSFSITGFLFPHKEEKDVILPQNSLGFSRYLSVCLKYLGRFSLVSALGQPRLRHATFGAWRPRVYEVPPYTLSKARSTLCPKHEVHSVQSTKYLLAQSRQHRDQATIDLGTIKLTYLTLSRVMLK